MADSQLYTNEGAMIKATGVKTALALSKLRLVKSPFVPTRFTVKADLLANECDFDGYTAGGFALTAWSGPIQDGNGGAIITSPLVNVAYGPADDPPITNVVGGWWIEDATGNVRIIGTYEQPRTLALVGQGFPFLCQIVEARNPVGVV